jgi:hypothetical protein
MKQTCSSKILFACVLAVVAVAFGCGKSGTPVTVQPVSATCVDNHKSVYDSICNMAGNWTATEHKLFIQTDSGTTTKTATVTTGVVFNLSVSGAKVVSYNGYAYTMVDSNATLIHFTCFSVPTDNHADIFFYPQSDSVIVASSTTTFAAGLTQNTLDTLFSYW